MRWKKELLFVGAIAIVVAATAAAAHGATRRQANLYARRRECDPPGCILRRGERVDPGTRVHGWPRPLELEEHSHAGMATAYTAGAANLTFGVLRGYQGTDLPPPATVTCPFTGEKLAAVRAHRPDVGIIHAQRADRHGNVQLWGIVGVQKEAVLASSRSIATVEEIVESLEPVPGALVLPNWVVDAVVVAPLGAHPSYAHGYYDRDNEFYKQWDAISRDRDTFGAWIDEHIIAAEAA